MCLLIVKKAGVEVPKNLLEQSALDNPHGWGVAMSVDGKLVVEKGLNMKDYLKYVPKIPKEQEAVLHVRFANVGGKELYNSHPFRINSDYCVFHNGTIDIDRPYKEMSDTWAFSFNIVKPMLERNPALFDTDAFVKLLQEAVEWKNKVVMMRKDGKIVIINKHQGTDYKGLWLSNNRSCYGKAFGTTTPYADVTTYTPTRGEILSQTPSNTPLRTQAELEQEITEYYYG